jgi:hypothetical protein
VLRRVLAYQNIAGATDRLIRDATRAIDLSGTPGQFTLEAARQRQTLWRMGPTGQIALEIALSESVERRMLDLQMKAVEFRWRREEQLAGITDEELTPKELLESHLRWMPVKLLPRE